MAAAKWIRGEKKIIYVPVDSATVITGGSLCRLDTDDVKPLSTLGDSGTEAQNQEAAHDVFLGVALRSSAAGETAPVPVATSGIWEFDSVSATYEIGALVGPNGTGAGEAVGVSDTQVVSVATANLAVGRVAKRGATLTRVQVNVESVVLTGGTQVLV